MLSIRTEITCSHNRATVLLLHAAWWFQPHGSFSINNLHLQAPSQQNERSQVIWIAHLLCLCKRWQDRSENAVKSAHFSKSELQKFNCHSCRGRRRKRESGFISQLIGPLSLLPVQHNFTSAPTVDQLPPEPSVPVLCHIRAARQHPTMSWRGAARTARPDQSSHVCAPDSSAFSTALPRFCWCRCSAKQPCMLIVVSDCRIWD